MNENQFDVLDHALECRGVQEMLDALSGHLLNCDRPHDWFEVRKMQLRRELGLPLLHTGMAETISDQQRCELEDGLLQACQKIGMHLWSQGKLREAWSYLRPMGVTPAIQSAIQHVATTDDNCEALIELCLYEGIDPCRGFGLLLQRFGTCNAITTLHGQARHLSAGDLDTMASLLTDRLYEDVTDSVVAHIRKREPDTRSEQRLIDLIARCGWIFDDRGYHVDISHLSSTVQLARSCRSAATWQKAWELSQYGKGLAPELQYPGEPPFENLFLAHGNYYGVLLDRDRDIGLAYFEELARQADVYQQTTIAVEVYVDLLARIGEVDRALRQFLEFVPHDIPTTGLIASPLQLAAAAGNFEPLLTHYRQHDRIVEYGVALALANSTPEARPWRS